MLKDLSGPWRLLAIALAVLMAIAVFALPYHLAVPPTVSESYRCGFNNHAALLLFLGAALLFIVGTGGLSTASAAGDRRLPRWLLIAGVVATLALCAIWRIDRVNKPLGSESHYQLNRQVQMVSGLRLYRDLEFIYGPLLEYPGYWLQAGLKWSPLRAYTASWTVDWLVGAAMLWCIVAWVDLPTRFRSLLFAFLGVFTLEQIPNEGTHYTPLRIFCAGFLSVAVATYWRRTHAPYRTATLMAAAVAGGFAVSPEQGTALALGLTAYAVLLVWKQRERFPVSAGAIVPVSAAAIVAVAGRAGVLHSMHGFAQGGNNFPLLPSPLNLFVLGIYVCALAVFYRALREQQWDSAAIAMGLCGVPMLSSAFGRCDRQHLTSAMPLLVLGMFWIAGRRRSVLAVWLVLACYLFLDFGILFHVAGNGLKKIGGVSASAGAGTVAAVAGLPIPGGKEYLAPFALPVGLDGRPRWGAQSGYFYGLQNVLTPDDIAAKAEEIRKRHAAFLLLPDVPGEPIPLFWLAERDMNLVREMEGSAWAPEPRRPLPSTQDVTNTINALYEATVYRQDGWRVWKLRS